MASEADIWIHDGGRVLCQDCALDGHAATYLSVALRDDPDQRLITTPLGTWERFGPIDGLVCEMDHVPSRA